MDNEDVRLMTTERDNMFRVIEHVGLATSCFQWRELKNYMEPSEYGSSWTKASVLVHVPSEYFYTFGKYVDQFSPGRTDRVESKSLYEYSNSDKWSSRWQSVETWITRLKEEIDAPDLWSQLLKDREVYQLASSTVQPGDVFTAQDKHYVAQQFRQIQNQLSTVHRLQEQQVQAMNQKFGEIVEGMNRFGKKDWLNWAIGALTGFALNAAFSPAAARDLFHGFIGAVGPLFDAVRNLIS